MNCSTSEAGKAGDCVITCTWLEVMSGRASMVNCVKEMPPQVTKANTNKPITSLLYMLNRMIESIIVCFFKKRPSNFIASVFFYYLLIACLSMDWQIIRWISKYSDNKTCKPIKGKACKKCIKIFYHKDSFVDKQQQEEPNGIRARIILVED